MRFTTLLRRPRSLWLRIPIWIIGFWLLLIAGRFFVDLVRPYSPKPLDQVAFLDHAESQTIGPVRVTASALSPEESCAVFGAPLALDGIQPIWLEVENGDTLPLFYLQAGTDPESGITMGGLMSFKTLLSRPRSLWLRIPIWIVAVWLILTLGRFFFDLVRPYSPKPLDQVAFLDHAESQTIGPVRVTASALSPEESFAVFGAPLALDGIQPIWLEVENGDTLPLFYLRAGTDPEWFSPYEAYWLNRLRAPREANRRMEDRFYSLQFQNPVNPGQTHTGFIFTRLDEGVKALDLDLVGLGEVMYNFTLSVQVPGFQGDYVRVDFDALYPPDSVIHLETDEKLRKALEQLPCCTTNRAGDGIGDPLNLVLIGDAQNIFPALTRRGWHPTEQTHRAAVWRTIRSFIFRSRYRYSPVSPLYVFGRPQDMAGQKARGTIHLRNHSRFWLTPLRFRGSTVWIGQISRDIGVRFILAFPPTTHKIDPDLDEVRDGLIQDLAYSQALARFAYVKGVGAAPRDDPRHNLTGDPYFTDGLRAVLFFEARPRTLDEVEYLEWETPTRSRELPERAGDQTQQR